MSYSIIGSSAIGSALAGPFASKGIEVLLRNSWGPASLKDVVRKLGSKVRAATAKEAANAGTASATISLDSRPPKFVGVNEGTSTSFVASTTMRSLQPDMAPTASVTDGKGTARIIMSAVRAS